MTWASDVDRAHMRTELFMWLKDMGNGWVRGSDIKRPGAHNIPPGSFFLNDRDVKASDYFSRGIEYAIAQATWVVAGGQHSHIISATHTRPAYSRYMYWVTLLGVENPVCISHRPEVGQWIKREAESWQP